MGILSVGYPFPLLISKKGKGPQVSPREGVEKNMTPPVNKCVVSVNRERKSFLNSTGGIVTIIAEALIKTRVSAISREAAI